MVPLCACNGIAYVYVVSKQAPSRGSGDRLAFLGVLGAFSKDMARVAFVLVACAAVDLAGAVRDMAEPAWTHSRDCSGSMRAS